MVSVKFQEILEAFEFVSAGPPMEHTAYVCLETGRFYYVSSELGFLDEDAPEDLEDSDRYLAVPHKHDLDLGKRLALRFADEHLPRHYDAVRAQFSRKGAYSRFKRLLEDEGMLDRWYAFEEAAEEAALRDWCDEVGLHVTGKPEETPSQLRASNLFEDCSPPRQGERTDLLLAHRNLVVERIVSSANLTPKTYVQSQDEWVLLVSGEAKLDVAGQTVELKAGDYLFLPSGTAHTVKSASEGALWLAVHLQANDR